MALIKIADLIALAPRRANDLAGACAFAHRHALKPL
jgi:hypothetical protein